MSPVRMAVKPEFLTLLVVVSSTKTLEKLLGTDN